MTTAINTFVIGFSQECSFPEAVEKLLENGTIKISEWVTTNKRGTIDMFDFYHGKTFANHEIKNHIPNKIYSEALKHIFEFCHINFRSSISHSYINKTQSDLHSDIHEFNKFIYLIYDLFVSKKIELVLFQEIPHDGAEIALYRMAKIMGIKTIIIANFTHFWGRILAFYSLEDFGYFNEVPKLSDDAASVKVDYDDFKNKMYYMKHIANHNAKLGELKKVVKKLTKRFLGKTLFSYFISEKKFNKTRFAFANALIQYQKVIEFSKNYQEILCKNPNLEEKYVYFALHLDPEIPTTPALAGIYCDQILALEKLRNLLPQEIAIYIKENPKQTDILRSSGFFDRLKKLKNVKLVNENTYKLINDSLFVATIAGTVGWEAITGNKNVIIFGSAWYQTFPGAFKFHDNLDLNQVINHKINRNDLEIAVKKILEKSGIGIVYFPFSNPNFKTDIKEIYPQYDRNKNIDDLCQTIIKLINYQS